MSGQGPKGRGQKIMEQAKKKPGPTAAAAAVTGAGATEAATGGAVSQAAGAASHEAVSSSPTVLGINSAVLGAIALGIAIFVVFVVVESED